MNKVKHISIYIERRPDEVYAFAANPRNLPRWAAGLARSELRQASEAWIVEAPFGKARLRFAKPNPFGVMDHDVEMASGVTVHNPMRVMPNGIGSEFLFTLFHRPGMSDAQFAADTAMIEQNLQTLKALLEGKG